MRRNSICLVNPTILIKRPISELAYVLKNKGWDVAILTPRKRNSNIDTSLHHTDLLKGIKIYTYPTITLPFVSFEFPIPINHELFKCIKEIKNKYRVIQVWTHFYISVIFIINALKHGSENNLILTMDTIPAFSFSAGALLDPVFRIYTKTVGKWLFNSVDKIHVYGNTLKAILENLNVSTPVYAISTGILQKPQKKLRSIRKEFDIDNDDFVVSTIGLVTPRKGIDVVLKIAKRMPDSKFLVVGEGPNMHSYMKQATDNVIFTGWRKDVFNILHSSDVLLLPSRGEGLPGIVFEAMEAGVPVVASDIPCIDTQIENGKEGFLCKFDCIEGFHNSLNRIKSSPKLKYEISKAAKRKIRSFYWTGRILQFLDLYE